MNHNNIALKTSVILCCTFAVEASAVDFFDPIDGYFDAGEYLAENAYGFLPVPSIITEPSVGNGLAVMGLFLHESPEQREKRKQVATRSIDGGAQLLTPGISVVGVGATDNGSKMGFAGHRQTWDKDSIRYLVGGGYGDINMSYYSQADFADALSIDLNMQGYALLQKLQYRVADTALFVGVAQKFLQVDMSNRRDINTIPPELIHRLTDIVDTSPKVSSLGAILEYDSLNNFFLPTRGYNYIVEYDWFTESLGSDHEYQTLNVEGINYWPLSKSLTLGFKMRYQSVSSDERLPVFAYPYIDLRGIPKNRYQGQDVGSAEVQLMWKVTPRWMLLSFLGGGLAGEDSSDMWNSDEQNAYGVGFRYTIARRYGLHMGMDVAKGPEDVAWYVNVGSGF
ncbi:BamA/TamA family outer membrane protein [Shewanella gelidimarina]|uniref:BamA/TamA family outer membrane protein n=1 Tax=Shewanella gelidimarina TaxID=56813 RepID=UPI00200EAA87|nr:BamA/TamA family outer membrane protein [Shewanella gelidimarina]MCL1058357.1 BamA/TamA family outer membrane protein [Shewanella gelidimarina]